MRELRPFQFHLTQVLCMVAGAGIILALLAQAPVKLIIYLAVSTPVIVWLVVAMRQGGKISGILVFLAIVLWVMGMIAVVDPPVSL